jgi:6-phosphogluconolactonase
MIRLAETPRESALDCARVMARWLNRSIVGRGRAFLAVSGGSTPGLLFDALAPIPVNWRRVHLFFVDERCVPPGDEQSNFRLAERHLVRPAGIPEENVHRIHGEMEPERAAGRYASELRQRLGPRGFFDVVQCGVGADGHTASLFPREPAIANVTGICTAVRVEKFEQHRVTLLPSAITSARHICVLVSGEEKRRAVRRALDRAVDRLETPARILDTARTQWFLSPASIYEDIR